MVRLYMSQEPKLVRELVNAPSGPKVSRVSIKDIEGLMVGVHLAVISEAMAFCECLGIDADLMFDIVSNAAGASNMFVTNFADMRRGVWSLKAVKNIEQIRHRLVSFSDSTRCIADI